MHDGERDASARAARVNSARPPVVSHGGGGGESRVAVSC